MKIIIPGGTGQVGTLLARAFHRDGHEVVVLSRTPSTAPWRIVTWDARTLGDWAREMEGADVVINLAGKNVNCRYTPENRRLIMDSRVESARVVGQAIAQAPRPPSLWLQASTATIYAHGYGMANDESGPLGGTEPGVPDSWGYSIKVATAWEKAVEEAGPLPQTRTVLLRSAVVMTPGAQGPFGLLSLMTRLGLGGRAAAGRQVVSWIHGEDFIRVIYWLIENPTITGPVNVTSPQPLPNSLFMRKLRAAWGIPFGLPAPGWLLPWAAALLGTETELILKSRNVAPGRLLQEGFVFRFPDWAEAARDLRSHS